MENEVMEVGMETVEAVGFKKALVIGGVVVVTGLVLGGVYKLRKHKDAEEVKDTVTYVDDNGQEITLEVED